MWIIRGAPGAGKTALIFQEFREALERGETGVRIVVPTSTLVRHFQHEMARDEVLFPPRSILTFSRFASECAPCVRVITPGLRRAIAREVLRTGIAPEFRDVASTEGMATTVLDTIDLFENAGVTPESLHPKRLAPLGAAFLRVWARINEEIRSRGFSSRLDLFREAAKNAGAQGLQSIWMDGFVTFSRLETELIDALNRACRLTLALPDGDEAFEAYRMALRSGAQHRQIEGARRRPKMEQFLPPSSERETDEICRRILALHSTGFEFRDLGVALRDQETYLPAFRAAFERWGIPARFLFAQPFAEHPVARFLGGLVECVLSGWIFDQALQAFRMHPRWADAHAFDRFDFELREAMPGQGAEVLRARIDESFRTGDPLLRRHLLHCLRLDAWKEEALPPQDWAARLASMTEMIEDRPVDVSRDWTSLEAARSYAAAIRVWANTMGEAVGYWPGDHAPVSLAEFWKVAGECVRGASLRVGDDRRNVVHVMSAWEARQWDVRALFVCGMSERDFPRRHPQNLFFPDADIDKTKLGIRTAEHMDKEEEKLFPSLRSRARDVLILSVPGKDAAGRSVVRSGFLLEADIAETNWVAAKPEPRLFLESTGAQGRLQDGQLLGQLAGLHTHVSPTGLEMLAQCQFQFFATKALRVQTAPEKPEERLNFLVSGNILHQALRKWIENGRGDILRSFEDAFDEECSKANVPRGYHAEVKRLELRRMIQGLNLSGRWHSEKSLTETEIRFSLGNGVELSGRADRIDIFGDECVVIDYKSGNPASVSSDVSAGNKLQGPLYALAAQENLGLRPVAMVYWTLKNDGLIGWGRIPEYETDLWPIPEGWIETAKVRVGEMLDLYLAGEISAKPADPDRCRWCDVQHACRFETQQSVAIGGAHA